MKKLFVFYHFFHPDPVVSSVHFSELCSGLVRLGWEVTAFPSNRGSSPPDKPHPSSERWSGVQVERVSRPPFRQGKSLGRILNAIWMLVRWSLLAFGRQPSPDVILIGTDPIFSLLIAPVWRLFHPHTKIVHWCFDLYPEAAYADGILPNNRILVTLLGAVMKKSYRACNLVVDIGDCMRQLLHAYDPAMRSATITPWAMSEPCGPLPVPVAERVALFKDERLALMYSGSFGRAHSHGDMLDLMRHLRKTSAGMVLSVRGNAESALRAAVTPADTNVRFVDFAPRGQLEQRLAAADIHVISLRKEWTGMVVPSKFFGALAVGRPVLFCGSRDSAIAKWIEQFQVGWVLEPGDAPVVADRLRLIIQDPSNLESLRERCYRVYEAHFSRDGSIHQWNDLLKDIVAEG